MRIKNESRILVSLLMTFTLLLLPVTALAKKGDKNFKAGMRYEEAQQWEKAAQEFTLAVAADPSNLEYQLHFRRASFNASQAYMQQGRAMAEKKDFVGAYNAFRQAYGYDPVNQLAASEMERMLQLQGLKNGNGNGNSTKPAEGVESALPQEPQLPPARVEQMRVISYSGDLKSFIRSLAEQLNLNVIFDRQSFVQPRTIDINLREVTTSQALDYIFLQEGLFFQKLSRRTIVVADQTRRPQYQQLVLRTFYLGNSDPEKAKSLVGQAIPPSVGRPQTIVVADKDTNSLTVRDTAENVRLIGELLQSIDKDRAEVVMDVNIYEVSKTDLMQFGSQLGSDTTLLNLGGIQRGFSVLQGGAGTVGLPVTLGSALIIPSSALQALQTKNRGRLVASTQVHAFNGEESTARIGQRVPVQTAQAYPFGIQTGTNNNSNQGQFNFPTGGFPVINYEPTGLTLKFTPQVFPNQDVQVKMSIESKDVLGAQTPTPTFTERSITGTARVQNNKTMMLASVSQDVSSSGRKGLPILSGLPIFGRLFSAPTRDNRRIDIVIAVTPRVLRAPAVMPRDEEMRPSGTLQSPTTGSLEAMLREADREEQLAEWRAQRNAAAVAKAANPAPVVPAGTSDAAQASAAPVVVNTNAQAPKQVSQPPTAVEQTATAQNNAEEVPAYIPAPKSLVSDSAASQVATVNSNMNSEAVLTSLPKPIETAVNRVPGKSRVAQLSLSSTSSIPAAQIMKAGERRRLAIEVKTDAPLALAVLALRFDPKVVKVKNIMAGALLTGETVATRPSLAQSVDPSGMCLVSISNLHEVTSASNSGTLIFVDLEAIAEGDAGLAFDKEVMHLVASDARDIVLEVIPVASVVKQ